MMLELNRAREETAAVSRIISVRIAATMFKKIDTLVMCSYSTIMARELVQHNYKL